MEGENVDWDAVTTGGFVQLEDGVPKELELRNWKPQTTFKDDKTGLVRPGVVFQVYKEDNAILDDTTVREWTVTAKGALSLLRPICEKAESKGDMKVLVTVVAVGEGKGRKYSIKEVQ